QGERKGVHLDWAAFRGVRGRFGGGDFALVHERVPATAIDLAVRRAVRRAVLDRHVLARGDQVGRLVHGRLLFADVLRGAVRRPAAGAVAANESHVHRRDRCRGDAERTAGRPDRCRPPRGGNCRLGTQRGRGSAARGGG